MKKMMDTYLFDKVRFYFSIIFLRKSVTQGSVLIKMLDKLQ